MYRIRDKWPGYLIAFLLIGGIIAWITLSGSGGSFAEKYEGVDFEQSIIGIGRENTYALYLGSAEKRKFFC